ncbi:polysaccharide deacetylase family protein [Geodermatophilus sp. URMC 64]
MAFGIPVRVAGAVAAAVAVGALRQSPLLAAVLARVSRPVLFAVRTTAPRVALTFDDGPHQELTPALAGVLARHGATATFFLLGSHAAREPRLVADLVRAGHEVGNHLWDDRPSALLSARDFRCHLAATDTVLRRAGARPVFLRPGSGWIRPGMLRAARRYGYRTALGSIAVRDLEVRDLDRELRFVLRRVRPGSIVVLHEGYDERAGVVPLTDRLLTALAERGFRPVTLSELAGSRAP